MSDGSEARVSRVAGALLGLAAGDALGWPAQYHRSYQLPFWTRRLRRELDAEGESTHVTRPPVPFSLNQPVEPLRLGPSDDAEWAAFTAMLLIRTSGRMEPEVLIDAWRDLAARQEPVRGPVSVQGALHNLRRGVLPPQSGHDNAHYMDDAAAVRAVPIGACCAGDPERAAALAERDAAVTNALDGLWAARAMAAAVAVAAGGGNAEEAVAAALRELPEGSWIARQTAKALSLSDGAESPFAVIPALSDGILSPIYSYGSLAPETIPLTLALVRITGGDLAQSLPVAAAFARAADSLPALVGGLCGALAGEELIPPAWRERCRLAGICLPELAGVNLADLARDLAGISS
ncbi:MAG TPA: ADP-ribosylglycohydrolase family protein [Symbiobacteriaceae bacterium]